MNRVFGAMCAIICTALPSVSSALTRDEIIAAAESYVNHTWTATSTNVCHRQLNGINVDTPEQGFTAWNGIAGWWSTSQVNVGIPYKWGGSDTPDTFNEGLSAGRCAGDTDTRSKGFGSGSAVGVDCSGFVTRVWSYPYPAHFSTGRLPGITRLLRDANGTDDYSQLKRGDILNRADSHVMLVATDIAENAVAVDVYEASADDWKVSRRSHPIQYLRSMGYRPHSFFNPADVELIIDRSGSMLGQKLQAAQEGSKLFVDLMKVGDKVGVVSFSSSASIDHNLTAIDDSDTVRTAVKAAIDRLQASGETSIGAGLSLAQDEFSARGIEDPAKGILDPIWAIVLLSDGVENAAPFVEEVLPRIIGTQTRIFTIGLGTAADQVLLNSIANRTNGRFRFAPSTEQLGDIYDEIESILTGRERIVAVQAQVLPHSIATVSVPIDSSVADARFLVTWPGSNLDIVVIDPTGRRIDPSVAQSDPNVRFASGLTYEFYEIQGPIAGAWTMEVAGVDTGPDGEMFTATVTGLTAIESELAFDREEYPVGQAIKATVNLEHALVDTPVIPGVDEQFHQPLHQPVLGANVSGSIIIPSGNVFPILFRDDGIDGDEVANDGKYTSTFIQTDTLGSYSVNADISGVSNSGELFTRALRGATVVTSTECQPPAPLLIMSVTASSFQAPNVPENTRDGNLGTRWSAEGNGQWILYDLGTPTTVGQVFIAWHEGDTRTARFDIEVSMDAATWTPVFSGRSSGITVGREVYDFPDVTTRFVRIVGFGNSANAWNSITEVDIYGADIDPNAFLPVASLRASDFQSPNAPENTLDNDFSTRWSAEGDGQWIEYDLGIATPFNQVLIAWYRGDLRQAAFDIEISTDALTWTPVFSGKSSGTTPGLQVYDFTEVTARFVRIIGRRNTENDWGSLTEVRIRSCRN